MRGDCMSRPRELNTDTLESKIIHEFVNYQENTMKKGLSRSVGNLLLKLKKTQFPDASEEELDTAYNKALTEFAELEEKQLGISRDNIAKAVEYIKKKAQERLSHLDLVTLYLKNEKTGTYFDQKLLFPFKHTFLFVLKALTDTTIFKNERPQDRFDRLRTLVLTIHRMEEEKICIHGDRNEMVFTLNYVYPNVELIEDERGTILAFLRDKSVDFFWQAYQGEKNQQKQKELMSLLINWMEEGESMSLLALIDPKQEILSSLNTLFLSHGINPETIQVETKHALSTLTFSCNPDKYPILYKLNRILSSYTTPNEEPIDKMLLNMKNWIKRDFQFGSKEHEALISNFDAYFYQFNDIYQKLKKHQLLLPLSGKITDEQIKIQLQRWNNIAETFIPPALFIYSEETQSDITNINKLIKAFELDAHADIIENFFTHWFGSDENERDSRRKQIYALLLREDIRKNAFLLDNSVIQKFIEQTTETKEEKTHQNLTAYHINRVFLHAILQNPYDWSDLFKGVFREIFTWVQRNFDQENKGIVAVLKRDSYPDQIMTQLEYLGNLAGLQLGPSIEKPEEMILLPEQIQSAEDWFQVSKLLDESEREKIYLAKRIQIEPLLIAKMIAGTANGDSVGIAMSSLPVSQITARTIIELVPEFIKKDHWLSLLLPRLSLSQGMAFLTQAEINKQLPLWIKSNFDLKYVLVNLAESKKMEFLAQAEIENQLFRWIRDSVELKTILLALSENQRMEFLKQAVIRQKLPQWISNAVRLGIVLSVLPADQITEFLQMITLLRQAECEIYLLNAWIKQPNELYELLNQLSQNLILVFLTQDNIIKLLRQIITRGSDLGDVLSYLSENQITEFLSNPEIQKHLPMWIRDDNQLESICLSRLSDSQFTTFLASPAIEALLKNLIQELAQRGSNILQMISVRATIFLRQSVIQEQIQNITIRVNQWANTIKESKNNDLLQPLATLVLQSKIQSQSSINMNENLLNHLIADNFISILAASKSKQSISSDVSNLIAQCKEISRDLGIQCDHILQCLTDIGANIQLISPKAPIRASGRSLSFSSSIFANAVVPDVDDSQARQSVNNLTITIKK